MRMNICFKWQINRFGEVVIFFPEEIKHGLKRMQDTKKNFAPVTIEHASIKKRAIRRSGKNKKYIIEYQHRQ